MSTTSLGVRWKVPETTFNEDCQRWNGYRSKTFENIRSAQNMFCFIFAHVSWCNYRCFPFYLIFEARAFWPIAFCPFGLCSKLNRTIDCSDKRLFEMFGRGVSRWKLKEPLTQRVRWKNGSSYFIMSLLSLIYVYHIACCSKGNNFNFWSQTQLTQGNCFWTPWVWNQWLNWNTFTSCPLTGPLNLLFVGSSVFRGRCTDRPGRRTWVWVKSPRG